MLLCCALVNCYCSQQVVLRNNYAAYCVRSMLMLSLLIRVEMCYHAKTTLGVAFMFMRATSSAVHKLMRSSIFLLCCNARFPGINGKFVCTCCTLVCCAAAVLMVRIYTFMRSGSGLGRPLSQPVSSVKHMKTCGSEAKQSDAEREHKQGQGGWDKRKPKTLRADGLPMATNSFPVL